MADGPGTLLPFVAVLNFGIAALVLLVLGRAAVARPLTLRPGAPLGSPSSSRSRAALQEKPRHAES
jgi:hypothetical protein